MRNHSIARFLNRFQAYHFHRHGITTNRNNTRRRILDCDCSLSSIYSSISRGLSSSSSSISEWSVLFNQAEYQPSIWSLRTKKQQQQQQIAGEDWNIISQNKTLLYLHNITCHNITLLKDMAMHKKRGGLDVATLERCNYTFSLLYQELSSSYSSLSIVDEEKVAATGAVKTIPKHRLLILDMAYALWKAMENAHDILVPIPSSFSTHSTTINSDIHPIGNNDNHNHDDDDYDNNSILNNNSLMSDLPTINPQQLQSQIQQKLNTKSTSTYQRNTTIPPSTPIPRPNFSTYSTLFKLYLLIPSLSSSSSPTSCFLPSKYAIQAQEIFDTMIQKHYHQYHYIDLKPNIQVYNTMIAIWSQSNHPLKAHYAALLLKERKEGKVGSGGGAVDVSTFGHVLRACCTTMNISNSSMNEEDGNKNYQNVHRLAFEIAHRVWNEAEAWLHKTYIEQPATNSTTTSSSSSSSLVEDDSFQYADTSSLGERGSYLFVFAMQSLLLLEEHNNSNNNSNNTTTTTTTNLKHHLLYRQWTLCKQLGLVNTHVLRALDMVSSQEFQKLVIQYNPIASSSSTTTNNRSSSITEMDDAMTTAHQNHGKYGSLFRKLPKEYSRNVTQTTNRWGW